MSAFIYFHCFTEDQAHGVHNLGSDQIAVAFTNAANPPSQANDAVLADVVQISYTNLSDRNVVTLSSGQVGGNYTLELEDKVVTSTGGDTGPIRYILVYNATKAGNPLIGYYDRGSEITIGSAQTFTVDFSSGTVRFNPA